MPSSSRSRNPFVRSIVLVLGVARRQRFRVALIGGFALPFHGVQRATGDVDFLAEARGSPALHDALLAAGARCLHRGTDAANYARGTSRLSPVDFIFARRERALDMLLEFLAQLEAVFGPTERTRQLTTGDRFLL